MRIIEATLFNEGLACIVRENDCPEYINTEFKTVFKLSDAFFAGTFSDGMAKFQNKEGKWGYVDKEGNIVIKPEYDFVGSFKNGLARVHKLLGDKQASWIIDKQGVKVFDLSPQLLTMGYYNEDVSVFRDTTGWGIFDIKGGKILSGKKEWEMLGDFFFGYASFLKGEKWGVINPKGEVVIDAKYENNLIFAGGLSAVNVNGLWGFINTSDEQVIPPQYDGIYMPFFNKTALVKKGKEYLFIDTDGKKINDGTVKYFNISLDYDELLNIDKYIQTDVFDTRLALDTIIGKLSTQNVSNLASGTNFASILEFVKAKGLKYVVSAQSVTVPQARSGLLTYSYLFDFTLPIGDTTSRFRSLEISFYFPQNMTRKIDIMFNGLKDMVQKAGFTTAKTDNASYLASSQFANVAVLKMNSQIIFSFTIKGSAKPGVAANEPALKK